jgi:hypothetical protein
MRVDHDDDDADDVHPVVIGAEDERVAPGGAVDEDAMDDDAADDDAADDDAAEDSWADDDGPVSTRADLGPAPSGGVFRRLAASRGAAAMSSFNVYEEVFAPTRHQARLEIEHQRRVGRPTAAPTDPPDLDRQGLGRPPSRFAGRVVLRASVDPAAEPAGDSAHGEHDPDPGDKEL